MTHLLSIVTFLPAAAALALVFVRAERRLVRWIASTAATLTLLAALVMWTRFQPRGLEWQFTDELGWLAIGVDGLAVLFVCLTSVVGWIAILWSSVDVTERVKEHFASLLVLQTGISGMFASLDLVQLMLCWFVSLAAMWVLIGIRDEGSRSRLARTAAMYTGAGTLAVLLGLAILCVNVHAITATWTFDLRTFQRLSFSRTEQTAAFVLIIIGLSAMAGLVPFHRWLRDVTIGAPPVVAMVVAACAVEMATFTVLRIGLPVLPDASRSLALAVMALGGLSALFGVAMGCVQPTWRKTIANASASQAGLIFVASFALTPAALMYSGVLQASHGLTIAMAFVTLRLIQPMDQIGDHIVQLPGVARVIRLAAVMAATGVVSAALFTTLHRTMETSIARVVLRVSPERAAEVADCLANAGAPAPVPSDPALPADMFMAAPCADGESPPKSTPPK